MQNKEKLKTKKCVAIQAPIYLIEDIDALKEKIGMSKNTLLVDLLTKGLKLFNNMEEK